MTVTEPFQKHYTVAELAKQWHMSRATLTPRLQNRPGVIKYGAAKLRKGRKRTHLSLRVPESVAREVYRELTGEEEWFKEEGGGRA